MNPEGESCSAIEQHLSLYVGRDLDFATLRAVEAHLAGCQACSKLAQRAERARNVLVTGLRTQAQSSIDLWPGVRAALEREGLATQRTPSGVPGVDRAARGDQIAAWRASRVRRIASLAAAAVLLGFFVQQVWWSSSEAPREDSRPNVPAGIVRVMHTDPIEVTPVAVVQEGTGLRRLAPGEARLIDSAEIYDPQVGGVLLRNRGNANIGSPASLQTERRVH